MISSDLSLERVPAPREREPYVLSAADRGSDAIFKNLIITREVSQECTHNYRGHNKQDTNHVMFVFMCYASQPPGACKLNFGETTIGISCYFAFSVSEG